jgi:hypothetical protein
MKACGIVEVYRPSFLASALDGDGRSATFLGRFNLAVPIELVGCVGPRAGPAALGKMEIFLPCLVCNPKVCVHVHESPLVSVISQINPVKTHTHTIL